METIALRFRDLVTQQGGTVREHREIIRRRQFTWWGWWKRPYEALPHQFLLEFARRCPLTIYLLDTGGTAEGFHLYPARLEDIAMTPTGSDIPSPDVSATPNYYNTLRLAAWFKLSHIEPSPLKNVAAIRIIALPTWPQTGDPNATEYQGLEITSQERLRRIDVTLWQIDLRSQEQ